MTKFRVHFEDGTTFDVDADHPDEARKVAQEKTERRRIIKVKVVKERADA